MEIYAIESMSKYKYLHANIYTLIHYSSEMCNGYDDDDDDEGLLVHCSDKTKNQILAESNIRTDTDTENIKIFVHNLTERTHTAHKMERD